MNKVVIANLNGNAYQLEEAGYEALRQYLDRATAQLKDNPDKAEIIADLEQAIAEKCASYLGSHKSVVSSEEVAQILKQMGPVDTGTAETTGTQSNTQANTNGAASNNSEVTKRLYRIRDGAMVSGVCLGLAAFLNIDVTIVRVIFVILTLVSGGMMALAYIAMTFIIPCANTGEERAAARGEPFNAQEVIDQAKKHYAEFKKDFSSKKEWRRHMREQRRAFKRRWREESYWWGDNVRRSAHNVAQEVGYAARVTAGIMVPVLSVVSAVLFCAWLVAMVLMATSNSFFGWPLPNTLPLWAALLILFFVYNTIAWTLRHARRAAYYASGGSSYAWYAAWDGMFSFVFIVVAFWLAYQHVPEVRDFVQHFPDSLNTLWNNITNSLQHHSTDKPAGIEHTALL